jgi:hypothetical protein
MTRNDGDGRASEFDQENAESRDTSTDLFKLC